MVSYQRFQFLHVQLPHGVLSSGKSDEERKGLQHVQKIFLFPRTRIIYERVWKIFESNAKCEKRGLEISEEPQK